MFLCVCWNYNILQTCEALGCLRGPGGVVKGLDSVSWAQICARELASVTSRASSGPPAPPVALIEDGTDDMYSSKVSDTTSGPKF